MGLRGLVYFVGTHTRSTVPRGRSAAALGADATVAQILFSSEEKRVGKGLKGRTIYRHAVTATAIKGPRHLLQVVCTPSFTAVPVGL